MTLHSQICYATQRNIISLGPFISILLTLYGLISFILDKIKQQQILLHTLYNIMKLSLFVTLFATAKAFNPSFIASPRASSSLNINVDRRTCINSAAALAPVLLLPNLALADGSVSAATKNRARGIYGNRIASLGAAVSSGKLF